MSQYLQSCNKTTNQSDSRLYRDDYDEFFASTDKNDLNDFQQKKSKIKYCTRNGSGIDLSSSQRQQKQL